MTEKVTNLNEIALMPVRPCGSLVGFAKFVLDEKYYVANVAIHTSLKNQSKFRLVCPTKKIFQWNGNPHLFSYQQRYGGTN